MNLCNNAKDNLKIITLCHTLDQFVAQIRLSKSKPVSHSSSDPIVPIRVRRILMDHLWLCNLKQTKSRSKIIHSNRRLDNKDNSNSSSAWNKTRRDPNNFVQKIGTKQKPTKKKWYNNFHSVSCYIESFSSVYSVCSS